MDIIRSEKSMVILKTVDNYDEQWDCDTPALIPDGGGGTLLLLEHTVVCSNKHCGGIAKQRISYVWQRTKREDLKALGNGASVKHYYTSCVCSHSVS